MLYRKARNNCGKYIQHTVVIVHTATIDIDLLTHENFREIVDLTWPHRAKWIQIGLELGIDIGTLGAIKVNNKKTEDCLNELIRYWLKHGKPKPTRAAIIAVVTSEHISNEAGSYEIILWSL